MIDSLVIGEIGKPHGLNGYAYVHLNDYLKNYNFLETLVSIHNKERIIEDLKPHLNNRHLIKLREIDSIEEIEKYRNTSIYIKKEIIISLCKELPWPEIYFNQFIMSDEFNDIKLNSYFVTNAGTVLELYHDGNKYFVPYNEDNFVDDEGSLFLINDLSFYNPVE